MLRTVSFSNHTHTHIHVTQYDPAEEARIPAIGDRLQTSFHAKLVRVPGAGELTFRCEAHIILSKRWFSACL